MKEYSPRILIVEEETEMLSTYVREFSKAGFEVHKATNIIKARHHIEDNYINAIFLEVAPESKSELSFVNELITKQNKNVSKVFVLASLPYPNMINKLSDHSSLNVLTKPLIMRDIVNAVKLRTFVNTYKIRYRDGVNKVIAEALEEILGFYIEKGLHILPPEKKLNNKLGGDVGCILPMSSDTILGSIALMSSRANVNIMSAAMLGDEEVAEISDEDLMDVLSEVCNQVAGVVKEKMKALGFPLSIGLPMSAVSKNLSLVHPGINDVGLIPMRVGDKTFSEKLPFFGKFRLAMEFCFDPVE